MADDNSTNLPQCTFSLNHKPLSALICGDKNYEAFSGDTDGVNNPEKASVANTGPIPPGLYYIVDRPVGGRFPWLEEIIHDLISDSDRKHWFALYAQGTMSDFTFVQGVRRGNFRLHPIGRLGRSEGCITLTAVKQFEALSKFLLSQPSAVIPKTNIRYYGTVTVQ